MKILTFTTLFPNSIRPEFGIFIKNRIISLAQIADVKIKVVAPVPWYPPIKFPRKWYHYSQIPKHEYIDNIEVYHPRYLVTPKIGMTLYGLWMCLGSLCTIKKIQKSFAFDLIDAHYVFPDGFAAIILGRFFKKPVVISARGTDINYYRKLPIIRHLLRFTLKYADHLVAVSSSLAELMIHEGAKRNALSIIPNGINPEHFYPFDQTEARDKLGLNTKCKILISVGNLIELKGFHILLEALHLLIKQGEDDLYAFIIGQGELKSSLERKIVEYNLVNHVKLLGHIPNRTLVDWYNAADLFFLGSRSEGWPNVVCEAQACGLPVVATPVNGIPEIIVDQELGTIVNRDPISFSQGIKTSLNREWNRKLIAQRGKKRTWNLVAKELFESFSNLTNNEQN